MPIHHGAEPIVPAHELRFVVVTNAYEAVVPLYRDIFGLGVVKDLDEQGGRGVILKLTAATLELIDPEHARLVDEVEAGHPLPDQFRIAVKVDDMAKASRIVASSGAEAIAPPVQTPWGDHNQRFNTKDGMQLTLFQATTGETGVGADPRRGLRDDSGRNA